MLDDFYTEALRQLVYDFYCEKNALHPSRSVVWDLYGKTSLPVCWYGGSKCYNIMWLDVEEREKSNDQNRIHSR